MDTHEGEFISPHHRRLTFGDSPRPQSREVRKGRKKGEPEELGLLTTIHIPFGARYTNFLPTLSERERKEQGIEPATYYEESLRGRDLDPSEMIKTPKGNYFYFEGTILVNGKETPFTGYVADPGDAKIPNRT